MVDHIEASSSRDEINVTEAEGNVILADDLNNEDIGVVEQGPLPQPPAEATQNVVETTDETIEVSAIVEVKEDYDDEPDETIKERLMALSEIFPQSVRDVVLQASTLTKSSFSKAYKTTCRITWILVTSTLILLGPIVFENDRSRLQEMQKINEKLALFGPSSIGLPR